MISGVTETQVSIFSRMTALAEQTGALNLGQGFPDFDGPAAVIEAAIAALRAGHNQYPPVPGVPALRRAIAEHQRRHYGIELDPDREIQVTFGATEALASALLALVVAGDEVAFLDPAYDSYPAVVALAGASPRSIVLGRRTGGSSKRPSTRRSAREPVCSCSILRTTRPAACSMPASSSCSRAPAASTT